jgi:hypothetical protein
MKRKEEALLVHGDCLNVLSQMNENSVDGLVTDPPAGIAFMGKDWDGDRGGPKQWIAWMESVMSEALRVLKPGAHALVWAIPRTSHRTATALENAGFEVRDVITHVFGSGFPKSLDISKAIDKAAGAEREVISSKPKPSTLVYKHSGISSLEELNQIAKETLPASAEAKQYQGFGTALKPASEHWILCRKPLSEKTVAKNVLKWGVGGLNIDASRVAIDPNDRNSRPNGSVPLSEGGKGSMFKMGGRNPECDGNTLNLNKGRFPANFVLSHTLFCKQVGVKKVGSGKLTVGGTPRKAEGHIATGSPDRSNALMSYGTETVEAWECSDDCAVKMLDGQSGNLQSSKRKPQTTSGHQDKYVGGVTISIGL